MNLYQLTEKCRNLHSVLGQIKEQYDRNSSPGRRATHSEMEYRLAYEEFHKTTSLLTDKLANIIGEFKLEFDNGIYNPDSWSPRFNFLISTAESELKRFEHTINLNLETEFHNIRELIISNIEKSNESIFVSMAWLTDKEIISVLDFKVREGIELKIIVSDMPENFSNGQLERLQRSGAKIWVYAKNELEGMMHNKFCIIDHKNVLTGSYNYTNMAPNNLENMLIVRNELEIAQDYAEYFDYLINLENSSPIEEYMKEIAQI